MSGLPKRSHEEGNVHSSSSSKYPHEDSGSYPKLMPPSSATAAAQSEHHHHLQPHPHSHSHSPYELDSRIAKVPRPDSRDVDRRSPIHSVYRVPSSSSNDIHLTHSSVPDPRESKDVREIRGDGRENRTEVRELYGEGKRDAQSAKAERDVMFESRGDDNTKEMNFDREKNNDQKGEVKVEKDGHGQLNWKEQKEYHRGKRFPEGSSGSVDPWHAPRANLQGPSDAGKEFSGTEERTYLEGHEAVGENKVDLKSEDRFRDKDKKRKDVKQREWGDRDKERIDRRVSLQAGSVTVESKETGREERESDRWERERKDQKDRERLKEREKDHIKRESWSGAEKEGSHNEKELGEASVKMSEQENMTLDQNKPKDTESWKIAERDLKDKRRERDTDAEVERAEKRSRCNEKESDDGLTEGEGTTEREKEVFNHGIQPRKRMLRPRGSPQMTNRDRFRSRAQDNEGYQGKSEVPFVVYKVGECMQELVKLWKEYESSHPDKTSDFANNGPTLEVRILAEHVTATNRQVRGGQLWGTDIYTDDSDLVAVLMHTGYCRPTASPPPPTIQELRATIRVLPPQDCYQSKLRNNVRSRAWGAGIGCSYRVERCFIVKKGGGTIELEPCLTHSSAVEPTLAPMAVERSMTTRAAASNALRQQRFVREVTIQYNLCNEPWIKYSISIVADKGLKKALFTSARLKKGEVLYLETHSCRYELCFSGEKTVKAVQALQGHEAETEKSQNHHHSHLPNGDKADSENILIDVFRWSRCKKPLPQKLMRSIGIPLPPDHVEVLEENLDWEDVQWSQTGVWIAGKEYAIARVHFLSAN